MKCHYTVIKGKRGKIERILIPECYTVIHTGDIRDCTCVEFSIPRFEKNLYNTTLHKMKIEILSLESEVERLTNLLYEKQNFSNIRNSAKEI